MSQIISKSLANEEIRQYMTNFESAKNAMASIQDPTAINYYTSPEISFIFEKNVIEALWALNTLADGLRVYYGSHTNGNPTLVLVPCVITRDSTAKMVAGVQNVLYSDDNSAAEWPKGYADIAAGKVMAAIATQKTSVKKGAKKGKKAVSDSSSITITPETLINGFDISEDNF